MQSGRRSAAPERPGRCPETATIRARDDSTGGDAMKFPAPHDVNAATIPGTEGWQRMYPYQYQFVTDDPVRNRYEKDTFWFNDGLHYPEPLYPFDTIWDEAWYLALSQFNNRIFMVPPVRGV